MGGRFISSHFRSSDKLYLRQSFANKPASGRVGSLQRRSVSHELCAVHDVHCCVPLECEMMQVASVDSIIVLCLQTNSSEKVR